MHPENSNFHFRRPVQAACIAVFGLGVIYAVVTVLGLLSLPSPDEQIADPYFTLMEVLILLIAPLMALVVLAVHFYAAADKKWYSLAAAVFMFIMAAITSCVHFTILTISRQPAAEQLAGHSFFFSFQWPSVVYALDILAWDWFYALSVFFAAAVFKTGRLEKTIRTLLLVSGILSLVGLLGIPFQNMQIRNIGIIGYAVLGPVAFLVIGKWFGLSGKTPD